jgi:hypothetical protein
MAKTSPNPVSVRQNAATALRSWVLPLKCLSNVDASGKEASAFASRRSSRLFARYPCGVGLSQPLYLSKNALPISVHVYLYIVWFEVPDE